MQIAGFKWILDELCLDEHSYTTTLHVINSVVVRLSVLTRAECVYRGIAGGQLSKSFTEENQHGVRGGVNPAFMSTSTDPEVAMQYARGKDGTGVIFKIQVRHLPCLRISPNICPYPPFHGLR